MEVWQKEGNCQDFFYVKEIGKSEKVPFFVS